MKIKVEAAWKEGYHGKGNPQLCAEEIMSIGDDVSAEQIVEFARNPESELHKSFTWDNDIAAEKWRVHEARQVLCNLVIKKTDGKKQEREEIRLFHNIESGHYKLISVIIQNEDEYQSLLRQCREALQTLKRKYSSLSEYQDIWDLIN